MLLTCQAGFESLFARELTELHEIKVVEQGPGWVLIQPGASRAVLMGTPGRNAGGESGVARAGLAFPHLTLLAPEQRRGDSVNSLASSIVDFFLSSVRDERIDSSWPSVWLGPQERVGLGRRIGAVEDAFAELLKKRVSRVAKLASPGGPRGVGPARGMFVFFPDFNRAFLARDAFMHGPRRMADDPLAPSRSYLKVEEAYVALGREPQAGETVCDLGAAPGGWSYSAVKRGAVVTAIDNGPLKGGALDHPRIEHRREDAFKFAPDSGRRFDWLFCDLVEEPHHVLRHIVEPWLERRWCRKFVVNLKFGRVDPIALLREVRAPTSPMARYASGVRIHHLYHDREEFTVMGEVNA
ncbi:MAG: SAM-dependent methyltransferase [Opitutaceae bacterium]